MVWWGKLNLVPMNHEQLRQAFGDWMAIVGKSPQRKRLQRYVITNLVYFLKDDPSRPLQDLCLPVPVEQPPHRPYSVKRPKKLTMQLWEWRNVGRETLGEFYDFLRWAADEGGYDFTRRNLNKLFPDGRPGTDPAP